MQMQPSQIWKAALEDLQKRIPRTAFQNWLRPASMLDFTGDVATIGAPNNFMVTTLQSRYKGEIERALSSVTGRQVSVNFVVLNPAAGDESFESDPGQRMQETATLITSPGSKKTSRNSNRATEFRRDGQNDSLSGGQMQLRPDHGLLPRYIFDTYVVGSSNRFAHAAALAVADGPGGQYNPLFVHGGVGLGKTHLLHAIGHRTIVLHPGITVVYVSSEKFTNDLINAIRGQRMDDFRSRYRTIDLLMIDDIQFIAGKDSTQEEFFHTFNTLYASGKQVVLSSDRPPKAITGLEDRLRSRFEGGLIADVQPPDFEMRTAILRTKADELGIDLSDEVVEYIAHKDQTNIRELEGALNSIVAFSRITGQVISLPLAMEALSGGGGRRPEVTTGQIITAVAQAFQSTEADLLGRGRAREIVLPRQVAMYLLRTESGESFADIGLAFGRDHTTAMHSVEKIEKTMQSDTALRAKLMAVRESLFRQK